MAAVIRVMLVDDHAVVRAGYRRLLEHQPDVAVLDVSMPGVSGLETIRRIISREPDARILVFSMHDDAMLAERAVQLGARGYITNSNAPEVLATAVGEVAAGQLYLSSDIANSIAILKLTGDENPVQLLSAREFEIFRLIIAGRPVTQIAALLSLSVKTVANYHTLIKNKLGTASDVELVLLARRHNLL